MKFFFSNFLYLTNICFCCEITQISFKSAKHIEMRMGAKIWICKKYFLSKVTRVVEFSSRGYKIRKNQQTLRKLLNFKNWVNGKLLKSGNDLKRFKNWFYQKMSITKNMLLNWYSAMKKKVEKDSNDFWHK